MGSPRTVELADGWTVVTRDGSVAAHVEHSIALLRRRRLGAHRRRRRPGPARRPGGTAAPSRASRPPGRSGAWLHVGDGSRCSAALRDGSVVAWSGGTRCGRPTSTVRPSPTSCSRRSTRAGSTCTSTTSGCSRRTRRRPTATSTARSTTCPARSRPAGRLAPSPPVDAAPSAASAAARASPRWLVAHLGRLARHRRDRGRDLGASICVSDGTGSTSGRSGSPARGAPCCSADDQRPGQRRAAASAGRRTARRGEAEQAGERRRRGRSSGDATARLTRPTAGAATSVWCRCVRRA